jgi:glycerol-3-phosphate dehydrogenase
VRSFSVLHRSADLADACAGVVDVLVVGAGATGAGVALDAASRGLSVVLVDRGDLASGTSSKSSKLIHGGLRYLENYDFGLVYEGVNERELLQRLAPHLVRPMDFLYPIFPDTARARLLGLGLTTYDVLAGWRNVRRHERRSAEEAVECAPTLASSGLERAYVYGDCATDDARLVLANVVAARRFGAVVLTYADVTSLLIGGDGRVFGARVEDRLDGGTYEVRARHVVNATGVWVDALLAQEDPSHRPVVQPSKGACTSSCRGRGCRWTVRRSSCRPGRATGGACSRSRGGGRRSSARQTRRTPGRSTRRASRRRTSRTSCRRRRHCSGSGCRSPTSSARGPAAGRCCAPPGP